MLISRGFKGKRREGPADRVPPGQYLTDDFPVLSAGPTPHTPLEEWTFTIEGGAEPVRWTWDEFQALPSEDDHDRHPLRDEVVEARHGLGGRRRRHAARGASTTTPPTRSRSATAATRRTSRSRTSSTGRPGSRTATTASRSTRSTAARRACSCRTSTSGRARSGCAASPARRRRARLLGVERLSPPWRSVAGAAVLGRLTWLAARWRQPVPETPRVRTLELDVPGLAGPPRGPAPRRSADRRGRLPGAALVLDRVRAR